MFTKIVNNVVDFVEKVPAVVWLLLTIGFVIIAGAVLIENVAGAMSESFQKARDEYSERERTYQQTIERVKRDCDLISQDVSPAYVKYTYNCDGVDYSFEESL